MAGRVFISCGQAVEHEKEAARKVRQLLWDKFGMDAYVAIQVQGLKDVMRITDELKASDYYLFVDFHRPGANPSVSVFTHQELALAHHLQFADVIALQQTGAPLEGFLRYLQSNPEPFSDTNELLGKVETLVRARGWHSKFSRNLIVADIGFNAPFIYTDHTGTYLETTYQVRVHNGRPDVAAPQTVCVLDTITHPDGTTSTPTDRAHLKWAGQVGYERTILPQDHGDIDVFAIHADGEGIFLHSLRDTPRDPIVKPNGTYTLSFKVFASGFQLVRFEVEVDLAWSPPTQFAWSSASTARLV